MSMYGGTRIAALGRVDGGLKHIPSLVFTCLRYIVPQVLIVKATVIKQGIK